MKFKNELIQGTLINRYKRFLADIRLNDGSIVTAHCPNPGAMIGCATPGWTVLISKSKNPNRKLKYTWEMVHNKKCWIGINTLITNSIVVEALKAKRISELKDFEELKCEVPYGKDTRLDIMVKNQNQQCYVEVKSVTLVEGNGFYSFPDSVTKRGKKHLLKLMEIVKAGNRGVMLYLIQRSDGSNFKAASTIDPEYSACLDCAYANGVEVLPYVAEVSPAEIKLRSRVRFIPGSPVN